MKHLPNIIRATGAIIILYFYIQAFISALSVSVAMAVVFIGLYGTLLALFAYAFVEGLATVFEIEY